MCLGAAAAYFGGLFDRAVTAVVDLTWSFPEVLIALIFVALIGAGLQATMIAIAVAYLAQFARLTRAQVMAIKHETYVEAAVNLGAGHAHIVFRHLLPNAMAPVIVAGMLATGDAIILEATLGFFGLGVQPPQAQLGRHDEQRHGADLPGALDHPGARPGHRRQRGAINQFGDALIDALDIRGRLRDELTTCLLSVTRPRCHHRPRAAAGRRGPAGGAWPGSWAWWANRARASRSPRWR
jgi:peptide/nickel transport system permease protein